ncbi:MULTISPECIES: 30S ribosomal protein S17 [Alteromonas]|jgi:small subunit ribosomal protein S17|uniref:30S ribosomal protein S17 n=1 Tax=Alteromonas TaxID=226 RepID=UPI00068C0E47|nr:MULTISPECIES: 30S ribosomal protein S17 [Alteromonas]CAI2388979.1 Ribosomal protein S17 [Alteromonas macleodii]CAI3936845.1 Ribosomal protein S17 [Alteromonas macleodii]CAI3937887.1 Ribosomal protein S17 [Alteromonas macleodii]CAI3937935.1 Ribosomal protein S17 [Alteromonas macleodii]VTO38575.1 Ribosomal protein S17 [Alteromonas macleodii]|tara:strand:+ start:4031 stop:4678 length:648 start_codon:yes stop_codon:yes gene_type:complete
MKSQSVDYIVEEKLTWLVQKSSHLNNQLHSDFKLLDNDDDSKVNDFPYKDIVLKFIDEISVVIETAAEIANLTFEEDNNVYDVATEIIHKWMSIASLYGVRLTFPKVVKDNRLNSLIELQDRNRKQIRGIVTSTSMNKTCKVYVERIVIHKVTGKRLKKSTNYLVHDEYEQCKLGDTVVAKLTRPISKRKTHALFAILKREGKNKKQNSYQIDLF